jgi:glycosyltransferase involved in cell wall biosynthesis
VRLRRDYDVLVGIGHGGLHRLLIPFVKRGGFTLFNLVAAPAGLSKSVIFAMKGMDGIITMSPSIALALRQHYYVRKPMASLPHLHGPVLPIDVDLTRRRIGHEGILRIGFFGRLSTLKRPDLLVRLWKTLDIGPARLEIFGDGEIDHSLREQINSLGLGGVVTMHGRYSQEESIRRVSETDLVVLPSQGEGLPQVLLESMAAGVPFVATNVGGVSDLGKENPDVEICKTDEYAIKAAIETMVKKIRNGKISPTRLQAIYQKKYSFKIVAEQWQKALFDPDSFFFSN